MTPSERDDLALAVGLLALAGFVDAVGFLLLGGLFVSFMSGNSTQFAIQTGQMSWSGAAPAGAIIAAFVAGVVVGRLIANAAGAWRRPALLALEAACLGLVPGLPAPPLASGFLMALAMGAQNGILHSAGRTTTGLTYVTGSLVKFGEALADALSGAGPASAPLPYLSLWLGIVAGGVTGAAAYGAFGLSALALPALAAALLAAATAWAKTAL
ncbi:YoaK family protein [Roseiarcus fermentans]|uniref:YoaK family protein n=1 Tax=Roseiarcus fermentans TaxID=1473586 RepID=UPI001AECE6B4|nr:YoaK family protein [Roseiarcus fermentans]